jgi:hypothetical protein
MMRLTMTLTAALAALAFAAPAQADTVYGPAPAMCFYASVGPTGNALIAYLQTDEGTALFLDKPVTLRVTAVLEDGMRYTIARPLYGNPQQPQHAELLVAYVSPGSAPVVECSALVLPPAVPGKVEP